MVWTSNKFIGRLDLFHLNQKYMNNSQEEDSTQRDDESLRQKFNHQPFIFPLRLRSSHSQKQVNW